MTLTEARKILGLGADEDPRPHLAEFRVVREKIAEMVRTAPNEVLAERYQQGLVDFDRALAAVREYLEALGLVARVADEEVEHEAVPKPVADLRAAAAMNALAAERQVAEEVFQAVDEDEDEEAVGGRVFRVVCWVLLFLSLVGFGGWGYLKMEEDRLLRKQGRVAFLERQGALFVENRRWEEAKEAFDGIEDLFPGSELARIGLRSIEAGMVEEQGQFIAYWQGEAVAAFETGRWDDAEKAAMEVLERYPDQVELGDLLAKIGEAKVEEERRSGMELVASHVEGRRFDEALEAARNLVERYGGSEELELLEKTRGAKEKSLADLERARGLLAKAAERDRGEFDEQAMEWMREALALAPDDVEIMERYEKMASYTRTIRVPEDVRTPAEALAKAKEGDRVLIGGGLWEGPLVLTSGILLEGSGGETVVEIEAGKGSAILILEGADGARVSGMVFRHRSFDAGDERFSLGLVRGGEVVFTDCRFEQGSGHGLAVIEGGRAKVLRCRFVENGWNGIAAMGVGSFLEVEESEARDNFQNGIETWDGAGVVLTKNRCLGNSRNGVHVDNRKAGAEMRGNELAGNREFGILLGSAGRGNVSGNRVTGNQLGGMVVLGGAAGVKVSANEISKNEGPGLVLEKGISADAYEDNKSVGNVGEQVLKDADLALEEELAEGLGTGELLEPVVAPEE